MAFHKYFNQEKNNFSSSGKTSCFTVGIHSLKINNLSWEGRERRRGGRGEKGRKMQLSLSLSENGFKSFKILMW